MNFSLNQNKEKRLIKNSINKVDKNLWLGGVSAAENVILLRKSRITHVLSIKAAGPPRIKREAYENYNIHHTHFDKEDSPDEDLLSIFPECCDMIDKALKNGEGILVHCMMGISRSATIVIAYLMRSQKLDCKEAREWVRNARPYTRPNPGFLRQLSTWESQLKQAREFESKAKINENLGTVNKPQRQQPREWNLEPKQSRNHETAVKTEKSQAYRAFMNLPAQRNYSDKKFRMRAFPNKDGMRKTVDTLKWVEELSSQHHDAGDRVASQMKNMVLTGEYIPPNDRPQPQ